ncbi:MAG: hypothetical protein ACK4F6_17690 [Hylemonella sp.]
MEEKPSLQKLRHEEFMRSSGDTLIEWQYIEESLYVIFQLVSQIEDSRLRSAIFYALTSTQSRVKLIDEIVKVMLTDSVLVREWASLAKKIRREADVRNAIAHGITSTVRKPNDPEGGYYPTISRPAAHTTIRGEEHWDAQRLSTIRQSFSDLGLEMYRFCRRVQVNHDQSKNSQQGSKAIDGS